MQITKDIGLGTQWIWEYHFTSHFLLIYKDKDKNKLVIPKNISPKIIKLTPHTNGNTYPHLLQKSINLLSFIIII